MKDGLQHIDTSFDKVYIVNSAAVVCNDFTEFVTYNALPATCVS